ncbi:uncharacterized protein BX663DRAFT_527864 [Cokeromyces recurvatus]|uniref:uncharacterized protein n=1 Tax=Cokeromyces recurvatus TaxID=90255 RepID=UPI00222116A3|nr:uncharacterized protein BX663DRAFT_527864 [Cokeromyces recurvatus]KAI7897572.1 hypothetical protein BX663DRAFT_527864 [Cokeromyces recurvatus]
MELNYCLFCEKRLLDDNRVFCSLACEANEASKSTIYNPISSNQYQLSYYRNCRPTLFYNKKKLPSENRSNPSIFFIHSSSL